MVHPHGCVQCLGLFVCWVLSSEFGACESSTALWVLSRLWLRLCRGLIASSLFCSGHGSPVFLSWRVCREDPSMSLRCPVFGVISAFQISAFRDGSSRVRQFSGSQELSMVSSLSLLLVIGSVWILVVSMG